MYKIFLVDLLVDMGKHLTNSRSELVLNFNQVCRLLNLVGSRPDDRRCDFVFEFILDLLGERALLRHLNNKKRYCLYINIDKFLLEDINSFIKVIILTAINDFL
jgi:hypothetical protein